MSNFLGIDIGGTTISYGLVNGDANILQETSLYTADISSVESLAEQIYNAIPNGSKADISGIGIGAPSVNNKTGSIEYAPNLNWGDIVPIKEIFSAKFNKQVSVINDANAAAIGEKYYGGAKEMKNFAVVTLGTGVGLGLYINGELVTGEHGLAGELGHMVIHRDGRECGCGNLGCLETYVGKEGIVRTAKEKLEFSSGGSFLNTLSPSALDPLEIFKAARKEDPVSLEVVDLVSHDLGFALAHLYSLLDLEAIFLTGGISKSGNILRRKTEKYLKQYVLPNLREKVQLNTSELNELNGAVLGAAASVKNEILKEVM